MRVFTFCILFIWFNSAISKDFPTGVCNLDSCSQSQLDIWEKMSAGPQGLEQNRIPGVYSGDCFWRGLYDSEEAHHAGILLEERDSHDRFDGRFSFYAPSNPYEGLDVDSARSRFVTDESSPLAVEHFEGHSFFDAAPGNDTPIWYWMRADSEIKGRLYLLAFWGNNNLGLCQLEAH